MIRVRRGAFAIVLSSLLAASGCLVAEMHDIPCAADDHCGTGWFCDIPREVCRAESDGVSAPDVQVTGILDEGRLVVNPFVRPDVDTELFMVVENVGGSTAEDIALTMGLLVCLNLVVDDTALPKELRAGARADVRFTVHPSLCTTPAIQDWFFSFSGRGTRGTFNILIERAPPSGD